MLKFMVEELFVTLNGLVWINIPVSGVYLNYWNRTPTYYNDIFYMYSTIWKSMEKGNIDVQFAQSMYGTPTYYNNIR